MSSGVFEECISAVEAVAAGGVEGLRDTNVDVLNYALRLLSLCRGEPGCETRIRGISPALAFCLEHDLDYCASFGNTTSSTAAQVCVGVFGRDEGGSEFTFTPQQIDVMLTKWSQIVQACGTNVLVKPTADNIFVEDLCVSDR